MSGSDGLSLCLFGAAPDTGNLGVSALCLSTIGGILRREPGADLMVFDHGRGERPARVRVGGREAGYSRCGAWHSRRVYRPESFWRIRAGVRLGGLWSPGARAVRRADAILDISGGDSFTDLYGAQRFRTATLPKIVALEAGRPLLLLPQTYGPFQTPVARAAAARIVRAARMAWARDERSFQALQELLGDAFDAARHRSGVDVAFALEPRRPRTLAGVSEEWLLNRERPLVGFNVSGLIYNDPIAARARFGFKADYGAAVVGFLRRVLARSEADVLLLPHVMAPKGHFESDVDACEGVATELGDVGKGGRVRWPLGLEGPGEAKWLIGRTEWFCGTRMHATIAALSSGVATAAVAYSMKTRGVFESCGQGEHVADPRELGTDEVVERLWASFSGREQAREVLREALPGVLAQAEGQMDQVVEACGGGAKAAVLAAATVA